MVLSWDFWSKLFWTIRMNNEISLFLLFAHFSFQEIINSWQFQGQVPVKHFCTPKMIMIQPCIRSSSFTWQWKQTCHLHLDGAWQQNQTHKGNSSGVNISQYIYDSQRYSWILSQGNRIVRQATWRYQWFVENIKYLHFRRNGYICKNIG